MAGTIGAGGLISTSNLSMLYDAAEPDSYPGSGTTWTNIFNSSNTLTAQGSPTFSTSNGGFFTFNGSSQYFNSGPMGPTGGSARTVNAWAKTSSSAAQMILAYGNNTGNYSGDTFRCVLNGYGGSEGVTIDLSGGAYNYGATTSDGEWHMYTWSASTSDYVSGVKVYMDGVLLTSVAGYINAGTQMNTYAGVGIHVGRRHYDSQNFFNGSIGPIAVYNTDLSDDEVATLYKVYTGRF